MRGGWGRKGGERGRGTDGGVRLAGLLVARIMLLKVECIKFCFGLIGIVLDDISGLKCSATLFDGMTYEADGTVRRTLGELRHNRVVSRNARRIRWLGVTGFGG